MEFEISERNNHESTTDIKIKQSSNIFRDSTANYSFNLHIYPPEMMSTFDEMIITIFTNLIGAILVA